jgi:hypothetical protein
MKRVLTAKSSENSDIKKQKNKSLSEKDIFSNILSSTLKYIPSLSENKSEILRGIKDFDIITTDDQKLYSEILFTTFIKIPNQKRKELYELTKKTSLDLDFYKLKSLITPETIINILSRQINLFIEGETLVNEYKTFRENYATYNINSVRYLLSFIDSIGLKILYIINDGDNDYISPLNNKKYRNFVRTQGGYFEYDSYERKFYKYTVNTLLYIKQKKIFPDIIDANNYDFVLKHNSIKDNNELKVNLINLQYNSSILVNKLNSSNNEKIIKHNISINKCNNNFVVNTTWKPFNNYRLRDINIKEKNNYKIIEEKCLKKTKQLDNDYFRLYNFKGDYLYEQFDTINIFSSKINDKIYKSVGGNICEDDEIIDASDNKCKNIYFPNNKREYCWFSSIINVLFNSDNISEIVLNKTLRQMNKTLNFINNINDYKLLKHLDDKQIKEYNKHFIILVSFIYSSFFILSKYKINNITNKKKWIENFFRLIEDNMYEKIYKFILNLEMNYMYLSTLSSSS